MTTLTLKEGADRRAQRFLQLAVFYGVRAELTDAPVDGCVARVTAYTATGETLTVQVTARYGRDDRIVTGILAWTTTANRPEPSYTKTTHIVSWFHTHATVSLAYLKRDPS